MSKRDNSMEEEEHSTIGDGVGLTLPNDTWLALAWRLQLGPDCTLILTLLETHKGALEWFRHSLYAQFLLMIKEREAVTSLLNRVKKMLALFPAVLQYIETLLTSQLIGDKKQRACDLTAEQTRGVLRIIRFGWDATTALYERHDQIAGFSNYVLMPLINCSTIDIDALSVGEIYIDKTQGRKKPVPLLAISKNLQSRVQWIDVHTRDSQPTIHEQLHIRSSRSIYYTGPPLTPTLNTHALCSVWSGDGKTLLYHQDFLALRRKMIVYSGQPALFNMAWWLDRNLADIIERLVKSLTALNKEKEEEGASPNDLCRLPSTTTLMTMEKWRDYQNTL